MPKRTALGTLPPLDLAYAIRRLVVSGATTPAEVLRLAAERVQRIAALEAELKALTHGGQVAVPATKAPAARSTKATKPAPKVKRAAGKLRLSPKLRAFRKIQGQYAGYLRGFSGAARERIRQINASEGAASAVEEMKTLLREKAKAGKTRATAATKKPTAATKSKAAKTTSARKVPAARKASRKLKITPKRKAALRIHGAYIGLLRGLPVAEQAKIKALAAKSGMGAAVEVMRERG